MSSNHTCGELEVCVSTGKHSEDYLCECEPGYYKENETEPCLVGELEDEIQKNHYAEVTLGSLVGGGPLERWPLYGGSLLLF